MCLCLCLRLTVLRGWFVQASIRSIGTPRAPCWSRVATIHWFVVCGGLSLCPPNALKYCLWVVVVCFFRGVCRRGGNESSRCGIARRTSCCTRTRRAILPMCLGAASARSLVVVLCIFFVKVCLILLSTSCAVVVSIAAPGSCRYPATRWWYHALEMREC